MLRSGIHPLPLSTKGKYNNRISHPQKGAQIVRQFAPLFYSTFFAIVRHETQLGDGERYRIFLPRCRDPPLLKPKFLHQISEEQEVCPMRQLYIGKPQAYIQRITIILFQQSQRTNSGVGAFCAERTNIRLILLQCAKFHFSRQKLFLIRSAASSLTVTLPTMDRMTGGGCG